MERAFIFMLPEGVRMSDIFHIRQIAFGWRPAFICQLSSTTELYWHQQPDRPTANMPRCCFSEMLELAEQDDGLIMAREARDIGIVDSVLARLTQRENLKRVAREFYRTPTSVVRQAD